MFERGTMIEKFFYESKPFLYIALALIGVALSGGHGYSKTCAVVLVACSALILYWRYETRQQPSRQRR